MQCKICNSSTQVITHKHILNKYDVNYHQCSTCGFIQTDSPFWLPEAYNSAITALDIGLINRNIYFQDKIPLLIDTFFPDAAIMVDYGGGYGMFVRMMRDKGFNFYRQDNYCKNLFADHFDLSDAPAKKFDLLTAFEVFEHLDNPLVEIDKMFALSDSLVFSTVLSPSTVQEFENWWYVSPLIGQHIAFYNKTTLEFIAKKFNKKLFSNGTNLHVFTEKQIDPSVVTAFFSDPKQSLIERIVKRLFPTKTVLKNRTSLLQKDYEVIEKRLKSENS